ncbi:peroxisomal assembly protein [Dipsacomyces acuminosporus]|nr:peroxisomal assembly protein [Dipsacomyces acuminosporus]
MPNFWTSDIPLDRIQVSICADAASDSNDNDELMHLLVPQAVFDSLSRIASQRLSIYVSIRVQGTNTSCIALVGKSNQSSSSKSDATPKCQANNAVWSIISGSIANIRSVSSDAEDSLIADIEVIEPVELSEVVFGVSSDEYDQALQMGDKIVEYLKGQTRIYSSGQSISYNGEIKLRCLMCQPVSHGMIRQGASSSGRVIIVKNSPTLTKSLAANDEGSFDNGVMTPDSIASDGSLNQWEDLGVEWFILGNTPFGNNRDSLVSAAFNNTRLLEASFGESPRSELGTIATQISGADGFGSRSDRMQLAAAELQSPVDNSKLVPGINNAEDLDNRGYMSLATLAKLGVISGSWISVARASSSTSRTDKTAEKAQIHRAIRVFGWDGVAENDTLVLPPLLFHNICASSSAASKSKSASVSITPLGSPPEEPSPSYTSNELSRGDSKLQPALEVAKKIVIARISSPLSERRDLESHALAALQEWLSPSSVKGNAKPLRVVKTGDLIAVRVLLADASVRTSVALAAGKDVAARLRNGDTSIEPDSVDIDPVNDLSMDIAASGSGKDQQSSVDANELVFYKIVKADGFKGDSSAEDSDDEEYESDYDDDDDGFEDIEKLEDQLDREWALWYRQVHGMGLVIQPSVTMVSQVGSVHGYAPYRSVRKYLASGGMESASDDIPYSSAMDQLFKLANASLHPLAIPRKLVCSALLKGNPGTGKRHLVRTVADRLGAHLYELSCYDVLSDTEDKTAQVLQVYFQNASRYTPCILHLRNIEALAQATNAPPGQENADDLPISRVLKSCIEGIPRVHRETDFPILVVATSNQPDKIPTSLAAVFRHEIELPVPDEQTRLQLLQCIAGSSLDLAPDADLTFIAQQTASFVARDLVLLFKRAENRAWKRARDSIVKATASEADSNSSSSLLTRNLLLSGQIITNDDLLGALGDARSSMSDTLGVPKIPNVKWDDVGGLADAKKDILDTIRLPMEQPHLFASGLSTRSGLLFYGPPGTGKTLLAKAIATECGLNFFSCKGPELISPYIGESEANVRKIFQKAREASPCVIFFDELDSLAPKRGQQGDSGGVMDRIVSQLLAELDGMSGGSDDSGSDDNEEKKESSKGASTQVFAIGATNRPDLLDPALLRPGRFDKLVYLGVSETHDAQLNIIQALTRKFHLHPELDLQLVAEKCPFHYTGADFYALCSDALLKAMLRTVDEVDLLVKEWNEKEHQDAASHYPMPMTPQYYLDHIAADNIKQVTVTMEDFERALDELIPSVSADELVRYQALRRQFDSTLKGKADAQASADTSRAVDRKGKQPDPQHVSSLADIVKQAQAAAAAADQQADIEQDPEDLSVPAPVAAPTAPAPAPASAPASAPAPAAEAPAESDPPTSASSKGKSKKRNKGKGKEVGY